MSACHPSMAEEEGRVQILLQLILNSAATASYSPISKHSCCLIKWDFVCCRVVMLKMVAHSSKQTEQTST